MNRNLLPLAITLLCATGCAQAALAPKTAAVAASKSEKAAAKTHEKAAAAAKVTGEESRETAANGAAAPAEQPARKAGDFVTYRFSGSFRKSPLTLTERVIDRKGMILTVDVTAETADEKREFRIKLNDAPGMKNEVLGVATLEGGIEKPSTVDAYDAFMAQTALAADENEALVTEEDVVLDVGGAPLSCHKASYRVRVGKKQATLETLSSDGFPWGDLGGNIIAESGKVLYRAEVIEAGHTETEKSSSVASSSVEP